MEMSPIHVLKRAANDELCSALMAIEHGGFSCATLTVTRDIEL